MLQLVLNYTAGTPDLQNNPLPPLANNPTVTFFLLHMNFPHCNCIHAYCVSPLNGALPAVMCVLHLQVILYTKEEVAVPPPQYINYKLIFLVMLTDHTTVFTLSSQSPCRYEPHIGNPSP